MQPPMPLGRKLLFLGDLVQNGRTGGSTSPRDGSMGQGLAAPHNASLVFWNIPGPFFEESVPQVDVREALRHVVLC